MPEVDVSDVFKRRSAAWIDFWRGHVKGPVLAEVRYDMMNLRNIDIDSSTFRAKMLVYVRVHLDDIGITESERIPLKDGSFCVKSGPNTYVHEYTPWIQFLGDVAKSNWVRFHNDRLTFCYELEGIYPLGTRGAMYPYDFHELKIKFTSNWDHETLLFVPWADDYLRGRERWPVEIAQSLKDVTVVDERVATIRKEEVAPTLYQRWKWIEIPAINFTISRGFGGRYSYSDVACTVFVHREVGLMQPIISVFLQPMLLAALAPLSIEFFPDEASRLSFNISLLIAMSVSFTSSGSRVTFADYYKLGMFFFGALVLVLASFTELIPELEEFNVRTICWSIFCALHAVFVVVIVAYEVFVMLPVRRTCENTKYNDFETVLSRCANQRPTAIQSAESFDKA
ncbi:Hypothetical Protein FCC1311_052932 [Hondaea fermentalgiana]|uniref:Neurotransmitter-gated ion-channel ligand-binding domain-containing protein n=1 Tax=Hondaea fermentalgiana TaxID=2315210 RepID=A0A2R5GLC3_9STRA|nr:Hypothetical Protein FCC1311_052932 [Hondaea fermentalgiana]|eukprot:GBG29071.1 Hypothetical Protein FCC1311_052932 [Hondaea fermentalgiana]